MTAPINTALHPLHEQLGAHFTDFGGWNMPLRYGSELAEHRAVREQAGLFDLSHMGEIWVSGPDAARFLNTALVGNLAAVAVGRAKYSLLCTETGGIVDDLISYRLAEDRYLVVPNAGNTPAVLAELVARSAHLDVSVTDASHDTSLIAVQGPAALAIVTELIAVSDSDADRDAVRELRYYAQLTVQLAGHEVLLARTGYTGEDGFEIYLPNEHASELWQALIAAGTPHGLLPAGLACRDSLRLEAGMPLYGNELSRDTDPFTAKLGGVVSFTKPEPFVGRAALEALREQPSERVLVGLTGTGRRAGRSGYAVRHEGVEVGEVTSGLLSPTLGVPIALAVVDRELAAPGTQLDIDVRGTLIAHTVVDTPLYRRAS